MQSHKPKQGDGSRMFQFGGPCAGICPVRIRILPFRVPHFRKLSCRSGSVVVQPVYKDIMLYIPMPCRCQITSPGGKMMRSSRLIAMRACNERRPASGAVIEAPSAQPRKRRIVTCIDKPGPGPVQHRADAGTP